MVTTDHLLDADHCVAISIAAACGLQGQVDRDRDRRTGKAHRIGSISAVDIVSASTAAQRVIPAAAFKPVVSAIAGERVATGRTINPFDAGIGVTVRVAADTRPAGEVDDHR